MSRSLAAASAAILVGISLAALAPPRGDCGASYRVVRGDTLTAIARRCGSSVAAIARASGVANPNRILVGQRLVIPGHATARARYRPRAAATAASYAMARGDTLFSLARWANVSLASLMAVNPGIDPHRIEIGDRIRLPAGARDPLALRRRERGGAAPVTAAAQREAEPAPAPARSDEEREPVGM